MKTGRMSFLAGVLVGGGVVAVAFTVGGVTASDGVQAVKVLDQGRARKRPRTRSRRDVSAGREGHGHAHA